MLNRLSPWVSVERAPIMFHHAHAYCLTLTKVMNELWKAESWNFMTIKRLWPRHLRRQDVLSAPQRLLHIRFAHLRSSPQTSSGENSSGRTTYCSLTQSKSGYGRPSFWIFCWSSQCLSGLDNHGYKRLKTYSWNLRRKGRNVALRDPLHLGISWPCDLKIVATHVVEGVIGVTLHSAQITWGTEIWVALCVTWQTLE